MKLVLVSFILIYTHSQLHISSSHINVYAGYSYVLRENLVYFSLSFLHHPCRSYRSVLNLKLRVRVRNYSSKGSLGVSLVTATKLGSLLDTIYKVVSA